MKSIGTDIIRQSHIKKTSLSPSNPPGGDGEQVGVHPRGAAEESCDADGGGVDGVQRHHHQRHHQVGEEHGEQEQVELRE